MLNYKNDPLLLSKENVNDLIKDKKNQYIYLDEQNGILNLFSAFIKKNDFIKKEKKIQVLQRTVYSKIDEKTLNIIDKRYPNKKDLAKSIELYIGRRLNINKTLQMWLKNRIVPLLLLRIISKDKKEFSKLIKEIEYFTDFLNKSRFYSPITLNDLLKPNIAYLVGCSAGDGNIDKNGKRWTLVDGSSKKEEVKLSKSFVLSLANLSKNFVGNYEIREDKTKCVLRLNNKLFCRFLNFFFGLPFGKKKNIVLKKPLIFNLMTNNLEKYFWRGLFDTDGGVNEMGTISFGSIDKNLLGECKDYLNNEEINSFIAKNCLNIPISEFKKFGKIGFSHPRKQKEFLTVLRKGTKQTLAVLKDNKKISQDLIKIGNLIRIDKNYRIRIHRTNLRRSCIDEEKIKQIMRNIFQYDFKKTKNLVYFKSRKVYDYLNDRFSYEVGWKPINDQEETFLLNEWNKIWY